MSVTLCIIGLGIVGVASWYQFMEQLVYRSEEKHRLTEQQAKIRSFEHTESQGSDYTDITVA